MAIRYVLVRFASNVGQFSADMNKAAAANKAVHASGQELAAAEKAKQAAMQQTASVQRSLSSSTGALTTRQNQLAAAQQSGSQRAIATAQRDLAAQQQRTAGYHQALQTQMAAEADATAAAEKASAAQIAAKDRALQANMQAAQQMGKYMLVGGAVLLAGVYEAVKAAAQFDNAMALASATSDVTRGHLEEMSQQVLHLSESLPIGAEAFASALTVAERAGYQGYSAIALLQAAAEGVVASTGDEQKAVEGLARTMNGFGLSQADLESTNNMLIASTRRGIGSYQDFAGALSQIAPLARAEHLSLSDVLATITVMSQRTQDASSSGMALTRMLFALTKEGGPAEQRLIAVYNASHSVALGSGEAVLANLGLAGTFQLIGQATQGNAKDIEDWFGNIRMAKGAFGLFVDGGSAAVAMMAEYRDANKMATEAALAFEERQKTAANQVKLAENNIKAAEITLGHALLPTLGSVAKAVAALGAWFTSLSPTLQKWIIGGAALAGIIMVLAGAFLMLAPGIASAGAAMAALTGAEVAATAGAVGLLTALGPVMLVAAPLMLIAGAFAMAAMHAGQGAQAVQRWEDAMKQEQSGTAGATSTMEAHELAHQKVLQVLDKYGVTLPQVNELITRGSADTGNFNEVLGTLTDTTGLSTEELKKHGMSTADVDRVHKLLKESLNGNTDSFKQLKQITTEYGASSDDAMHVVSTLSHENRRATQSAKDLAAQNNALVAVTKENNRALLDTGQFAGDASDDMKKLSEQEKDVKNAITGMVEASHVFSTALERVKADAKGFADSTDVFKDSLKTFNDAVDQSAQAAYDAYKKGFDKQVQDLQDQQTQQTNSISDQVSAYRALGDGTKATNYVIRQDGKDTTRSIKDNYKDQIDALKSNEKSLKDFQNQAKKSKGVFGSNAADMNSYMKGLEDTAKATDQWNSDLKKIASRGGTEQLVDQLRNMGKDGIPLVHQFADGVESNITRANAAVASLTPNVKVSFDDFQKTLHKQMQDEADFEKNLMALGAKGKTDLMDYFAKAGPDSAGALADAVKLDPNDPKLVQANSDAKDAGAMSSDSYVKGFSLKMDVLSQVAADAGKNAGGVSLDALTKELAATGLNKDQIAKFLGTVTDQLSAIDPSMKITLIPEVAAVNAGQGVPDWVKAGMSEDDWNKLPPERRRQIQANLFADGGIMYFGSGGENHVAQFANAGTYRVWAEPETGGEAYIPLGSSKRQRSTAILGNVADRFGYGLTPTGASPAGAVMTGQTAAQAPTVVVVKSSQPVSQSTTYAFNGPIQGYSLEKVQQDADRKRRLSALTGPGRAR